MSPWRPGWAEALEERPTTLCMWFGSTEEVGLLEMTARGFEILENPEEMLLERSTAASAGACAASVVVETNRPVVVEIQALCSRTFGDNNPRHMVNGGLDYRRMDQTLAVLIKHAKVKLYDQDVRLNVLGGLPATEPAMDVAMAAAVLSSFYEISLPLENVYMGELDLGGQLRKVTKPEKRVAAAVSRGFSNVICPIGTKAAVSLSLKQHVIECRDIAQLKTFIAGDKAAPRRRTRRKNTADVTSDGEQGG